MPGLFAAWFSGYEEFQCTFLIGNITAKRSKETR